MFGLKTVQVLHWHLFRGITNYLASSRGLATAEVGEMKRRKKNTSFPFGISWWLLQLYAFRQDFFFVPRPLDKRRIEWQPKAPKKFCSFLFFRWCFLTQTKRLGSTPTSARHRLSGEDPHDVCCCKILFPLRPPVCGVLPVWCTHVHAECAPLATRRWRWFQYGVFLG